MAAGRGFSQRETARAGIRHQNMQRLSVWDDNHRLLMDMPCNRVSAHMYTHAHSLQPQHQFLVPYLCGERCETCAKDAWAVRLCDCSQLPTFSRRARRSLRASQARGAERYAGGGGAARPGPASGALPLHQARRSQAGETGRGEAPDSIRKQTIVNAHSSC